MELRRRRAKIGHRPINLIAALDTFAYRALHYSSGERILEADPLGRALRLMMEALALVDSSGAPADIGAHLDLAIHRIRETTGDLSESKSSKPIAREGVG